MVIEKHIAINKGIKETWQLLGVDFAGAYKWASAVNHSEGSGENFQGASCSERGCSTTMGGIKEKLISFSNEKHSLSYIVSEGMPSMIGYASNTWQLISKDDNTTELRIEMDIQTKGILCLIMQPIIKFQFSMLGNDLIHDFKHYAETGRPSEKKFKAIQKNNKQYEVA